MKKIADNTFVLETDDEIYTAICEIGERHPLLQEVEENNYSGSLTFILKDENGRVVSINQTRISKAKSSIWRPYASFNLAYTVKSERKNGYAKKLLRQVQKFSIEHGCRRMKSLAASNEGLYLHLSVCHKFWGRTSNNEICIDTPLTICDGWNNRTPPSVIASKLIENFTDIDSLLESVKKTPLFFDMVEK